MKIAFEGKLVPRDLNDEPAAVMLQRIRIKKAKHQQESSIHVKPKSKLKEDWRQTSLV